MVLSTKNGKITWLDMKRTQALRVRGKSGGGLGSSKVSVEDDMKTNQSILYSKERDEVDKLEAAWYNERISPEEYSHRSNLLTRYQVNYKRSRNVDGKKKNKYGILPSNHPGILSESEFAPQEERRVALLKQDEEKAKKAIRQGNMEIIREAERIEQAAREKSAREKEKREKERELAAKEKAYKKKRAKQIQKYGAPVPVNRGTPKSNTRTVDNNGNPVNPPQYMHLIGDEVYSRIIPR